MQYKGVLRNERGFTLIEIIAVLILLGILAAVAVPKYISLEEEAKTKALQGAIAEAKGVLSIAYGRAILAHGGQVTDAQEVVYKIANTSAISGITGTATIHAGDFDLSFNAATDAAVEITAKGNGTVIKSTDSTTATWNLPS